MNNKFLKAIAFVLAMSGVAWAAGSWSTNNYGYKPQLTTQGTTDYAQFNISMDRIDAALAAGGTVIGGPLYATLDAALVAGATGNIIIPTGVQTLSASVDRTVLAGANLVFVKGATVVIPVGRTLTINGTMEAGLYQVFTCTGTGKVVFGLGKVDRILPQWWGAKGDGATDDTVAIEAAWAACWVTPPEANPLNYQNPPLYFVNGKYVYSGTGLTRQNLYGNIVVKGDGPGTTCIWLSGTAQYFIDTDYFDSFRMSGLMIRNGKGAFRQTGAAINNLADKIFDNLWIYNYTECGIGFNSVDTPYIRITNSLFRGIKTSDTIGIALSGDPSGSVISGNAFHSNRYHMKIPGAGKTGVFIRDNDFIRFNADGPNPCYDIWVVPDTLAYPCGITINSNKFGNENLGDNDVRILVADEGAGTYNSDKHHATTASTGYVWGMKVRDNTIATTATNLEPIMYSYTPYIYDLLFENQFYAGYPSSILGFAAALSESVSENRQNNFSYKQVYGAQQLAVSPPSSDPGVGHVDDPHGYLEGQLGYPHYYPGAGTDPSYVKLLITDILSAADWGVSDAGKTPATDSVGGTNATTVAFTDAGGMLYSFVQAASLVAGRSGFVEFDIKVAAATPLTEVVVSTHLTTWAVATKRIIKVPATWTRVRLPFTTRDVTAMFIRFMAGDYAAGTKTSVIIGRPAIYYAQEPVNLGVQAQYLGLPVLTAVPNNPFVGMIVLADRATWDPSSIGSGGPYLVWCNKTSGGVTWARIDAQ